MNKKLKEIIIREVIVNLKALVIIIAVLAAFSTVAFLIKATIAIVFVLLVVMIFDIIAGYYNDD